MSIPATVLEQIEAAQERKRRRRKPGSHPSKGSGVLELQQGSPTQQLGLRAETLALEYLQAHGLVLLARNLRSRVGEIDLLMCEGRTVVAIEVRSRHWAASLPYCVTPAKCRRIALTLQCRLPAKLAARPIRIDAVLINWNRQPAGITWLSDIWQARNDM